MQDQQAPPPQQYPPQGYPPQGYPPQGYPPQGYPQYPPQGYPPQGYPPQGYPPQGYPPQGYPPQGYPPQGYPQQYPPQGYPPQGYPPQGYPPQGYPPQQGPPQQGGGGAPPQQQQSGGGWASLPPLDSFADWSWDNNAKSWGDQPQQSRHFKFDSSINPRYCTSTPMSMWQGGTDLYDLENEALLAKLSNEKPEPGQMNDAEPFGDIVFSVGSGNNFDKVRVHSISSTEQAGYWKGVGEHGLDQCTVIETPSLLGVATGYNGGGNWGLKLFDITTCKPAGKIQSGFDVNCNYVWSHPTERSTFYCFEGSGKIHQYDARAKKKTRTLFATCEGMPTQVSFPHTSGGKFVLSHSFNITMIDSATGKVLHTGRAQSQDHYAVLERNMLFVGSSNKLWFFDTNKLTEKEINFDSAEYDMPSELWVTGLGYGQGKLHVISTASFCGWRTLSHPSLKKN